LAAIDALTRQIDRFGAAFGLFPIVLECTPTPVLGFVDLVVCVQFGQRIATGGTQGDDPVAGLEAKGIIDLHGRNFRVEREILSAPVIDFRRIVDLPVLPACHA
jgi:hypothetical protein